MVAHIPCSCIVKLGEQSPEGFKMIGKGNPMTFSLDLVPRSFFLVSIYEQKI